MYETIGSRSAASAVAASFFALAALASVGCGEVPQDAGEDRAVQSGALAAAGSRTFLVGFTSGQIPANAASLIGAAGGAVVTRYESLGVVLARSASAGFAAALRAAPGVDAVADAKSVHSSVMPMRPAGRRGPSPVRPPAGPPVPGSDPLSFRQWDMDQIRAPQARAISGGKKSVLVGVLDSGVDITHPDMVGQVSAAASASCVGGVANPSPAVWGVDPIGHGTHVSGIIAGAKNGVGIVGVAPGVQLAAIKVAVDDFNDPNAGLVFADAIVCAVDWALGHGVDIMNASLTIDEFTAPIDDIFCADKPDEAAVVRIVRRAILQAARKKVALVAAAGNFFLDLRNLHESDGTGVDCKVIPVQLPRVIGVSSVAFNRSLASYSDYGLGAVDLTGPGGDLLVPDPVAGLGPVLSSVPPDSLIYQVFAPAVNGTVQDCSSGTCSTYAYVQGTSQATPHVTGVAALLESRFGRLPPEALLAFMSLTATPIPCPQGPYDPGMTGNPATCVGPAFYNSFYGAGEVDALAAVR